MFDYAVIHNERLQLCTRVDGDEYFLDVYSSMPHIDDVRHNKRLDNQLVHQICDAVRGFPHAGDFTLTRLHRHFTLQLRERLVEEKCIKTGNPVLKPTAFSENNKYLPTSFKFIHTNMSATEIEGDGVLTIVPLEYREIPDSDDITIDAWFSSDRVRVMHSVGLALKHLDLIDTFGIAIGDIPDAGKVWIERTYLKDRSHRLTLEG